VRNLLSKGMSVVLAGLREIEYFAEWSVIPAVAVGAAHLRERVWIVARPREYARVPVFGDVARRKRTGEMISFDLDGKLPRDGRMGVNLRELVPLAPRKTQRRDGWTYWTGVNLWSDALPTLPAPRGTDGERGGRGDLLQVVRGNQSSSGHFASGMWPTPNSVDALGGRTRMDERFLARTNGTGTKSSRPLAAAVAAVERGIIGDPKLLWPSSSSRDHKDVGDLICVPDNGLLPRRVFHVEQGTAMMPTPVAGDADGSRKPIEGTTLSGRRPDGSKAPVSLQSYVRAMEEGTALLPTPDAYGNGNGNGPANHMQKKADKCGGPRSTISNLDVIARNDFRQANGRLWPTTTTDAKAARNETSNDLDDAVAARGKVNGSLSPTWVSWLMAIPLDWCDLSWPNEWLWQAPWDVEPYELSLQRVAKKVENRTQRLRAIGNSVVWPCAYIALKMALDATDLA
jgi:site-specific DNA-cytosine methylase